ncbi:TetR/AcrR family transcriptional regulator [Cellulomonas iranensis]|uniref:TetR/AcrR family transcriptional regulator n=1 Tax=Cellulomonas iranensis TaxID=76862 RepID=UPI001CF25B7B|nr:TetR/AcrR family transcriptional regulator [Cellulomonas iranensis]UCN15462.1 TetR/AcrR family transcriptional regulator [Cellulomonas iranensis]
MPTPPEPASRRERPAKPALSRQAILDATLALVRERGVERVSLRDVARAVATGPASLYAYFDSRETLLEHALDHVYATVELVDPEPHGWRAALAGTVVGTVDALERHPGLATVALGTIPTLPGALRLAEHELDLLRRGGVPDDRAALAIDLIAQFAAATAVERTSRGEPGRRGADPRRAHDVYADVDPDRFPHVHRLAGALTGPDERARRDFAIDVILAGLDATTAR